MSKIAVITIYKNKDTLEQLYVLLIIYIFIVNF
jgi:hypothetical protein